MRPGPVLIYSHLEPSGDPHVEQMQNKPVLLGSSWVLTDQRMD